jgi:hypothetical protein
MLGGIEKSEVTPPPTQKKTDKAPTKTFTVRVRPVRHTKALTDSASVHARMCNSPLHPSPRVCAQGLVQQLSVLYGAV